MSTGTGLPVVTGQDHTILGSSRFRGFKKSRKRKLLSACGPVVNVSDHLKKYILGVDDFADQKGQANEDIVKVVFDNSTETVSDLSENGVDRASRETRKN